MGVVYVPGALREKLEPMFLSKPELQVQLKPPSVRVLVSCMGSTVVLS